MLPEERHERRFYFPPMFDSSQICFLNAEGSPHIGLNYYYYSSFLLGKSLVCAKTIQSHKKHMQHSLLWRYG